MKTKKIFLCRHAETDMNKSRLCPDGQIRN